MKNVKLLIIGPLLFGLSINISLAQVSVLGNSGLPTDYLGWNNTNNFPLQIRHNGNHHINLYTNSVHRLKLNPDVAYAVDGYAGDRNGKAPLPAASPQRREWLLGNSTVCDS
jgi:hypothetical protein